MIRELIDDCPRGSYFGTLTIKQLWDGNHCKRKTDMNFFCPKSLDGWSFDACKLESISANTAKEFKCYF